MIRSARLAAALVLVLIAAACGEVPTAAPDAVQLQRRAASVIVPGTCTNLSGLNALASVIFTPSSSPSISSVLGKLKNLDKAVKKGSFADARAKANEIVAFTLKKYNQGGLGGTAAQLKAFTNAVFCFAGIDLAVVQPANTFFILPADTQQVVLDTTGTAGIRFDANPVSEPTLVRIEIVPDTFPQPGGGPLVTKLDQYPGFIQIIKTSETNAPLTKPVVVGVCAAGVIPLEVRNRLRLGHGATAGFEITPPATASFLTCPNQIADAGPMPRWKRLVNLLLPTQLHAFQSAFGGGVGGTVTEFSPFAPVDPQLAFGGGVGGTVTEFIRVPAPGPRSGKRTMNMPNLTLQSMNMPSIIEDPCAFGTAGLPLSAGCVPSIQVTTRLGTVLANVPVSWAVAAGGGVIAPKTTTCGAFGPTAATNTNADGRAGICWTLGAPGANRVTATPSVGGDAPAGVEFVPTSATFEVTATAGLPAAMSIVQGGSQQWGVPAGSVVPIAPIIKVTDAYGYPVAGVAIAWASFPNDGVLSTFNPAHTTTGADGTATTIWTLGDRYAHILAYFYLATDGSTSSVWSAGAVKFYVTFDATTEF